MVLYPEKLTFGWTSFRGAGHARLFQDIGDRLSLSRLTQSSKTASTTVPAYSRIASMLNNQMAFSFRRSESIFWLVFLILFPVGQVRSFSQLFAKGGAGVEDRLSRPFERRFDIAPKDGMAVEDFLLNDLDCGFVGHCVHNEHGQVVGQSFD